MGAPGYAQLFYSQNEKLVTMDSGVKVSGITSTTNLNVVGVSTLTGIVKIGTNIAGRAGADELTIGNASGDIGITLRSGTSDEGNIYFGDSTSSGNAEQRGIIRFDHSDDSMQFFTANGNNWPVERLRITSAGHIIAGGQGSQISFNNVGNDAFGCVLELDGSHTTDHHGMLSLVGKTDTNGGSAGKIQFVNSQNSNGSSGSNAGSKNVASIEGQIVTTDSNAGDDCGGLLRFVIKADGGANAEAMRIISDGKIGIGDASPASLLSLKASNPTIRFTDGSTLVGAIEGDTTANTFYGYNGADIVFSTHSSTSYDDRLRVDSDGRVIVGGGTHAGGGQFVVMGGDINSYGCMSIGNRTAAPTNNTTFAMFRLSAGSGGTSRGAEVLAAADANWSAGSSYPSRLVFKTTPSGATASEERLRINSTGAVTINSGNASNNAVLILSKSDAGYAKLEFDVGTSQKAYIDLDASEDLVHYGASGVGQVFYSGTGERLRIKSDGQIVIKSYNHGQYFLDAKNSAGTSIVRFYESSSGDGRNGMIYLDTGAGDNTVKLCTNNYSYFTGGGIVIGNTTPTFSSPGPHLCIESNNNTVGPLINLYNAASGQINATCEIRACQNYRDANRIIFGRENSSNWQAGASSAASYISFWNNSGGAIGEKMRIDSAGALWLQGSGSAQVIGGLGAVTTGGTTDFNHSTNARSGNGYTLLHGSHSNAPGGGAYYHVINFEYASKSGGGNMTQVAIPYNGGAIYTRYRYSGTWYSWTSH
jgi:hypothetical protein